MLAKWKAVISLSHALSRIHKHPKAISAVSHPHLTHELDVASGQRLVYEPFVDAAVLKAWEEYERAAALYEEAAEAGLTVALVNLANMYLEGLGVAKSRERARELLQQAAPRDHNARTALQQLDAQQMT